ncbi:MAG: hypothetical protein N3H31_05145 [Candidatus Nezhaarchaeota archaeon]|nr:hypothetical protein [Candidatus Nezhaarchaeota archaeon]
MSEALAAKHYSKPEVKEEVARYSKDRWVALHCEQRDSKGRRLFIRYDEAKPLTIQTPSDVEKLLARFKKHKPRSFYASSNLYAELAKAASAPSIGSVYACTPCWDVDNGLHGWRDTLELCEELVSLLDKEGVAKSVSVFWSGRGAHVRIHHLALSSEVRANIPPFDAAYAIVEYIVKKMDGARLNALKASGPRLENRMDPQRVFTCPLSLHRDLDVVCICVPLNKLCDFDPSWIEPDRYKHSGGWDVYEEGEADDLAMRAYEAIGGYPLRRGRRKYERVDKAIVRALTKISPKGSPLGL